MTDENGVLIRLAGCFSVERNGVPYPRGAVGGKARRLLKLLAAERNGTLAADRVAEELWPGGGPKRPVQNVATLVSRLRGALGSDIVTGGRTGYRLGRPPGVRVDLDLAAGLVGEAEGCLAAGEPVLAGSAAGRALELLHDGVVLACEPDARWVAAIREEAAGLVRRARHAAAGAGLHGAGVNGAMFAKVRRVAEAAVRADPFDEVAYRLLMRAHVAAGEPAKALLAYERLRHRLATELGTDPAAETRAVHLAILREEPPAGTAPSLAPVTGAVPLRRQSATGPVPRTEATAEIIPHPEVARGRAGPWEAPLRVAGPGPVLAGRDEELARISGAWSRAVSGCTGVLLIAGEAGVGKSRLAVEAERMAGAAGGIVLRARCHEIERALFLQPVVDALRPRIVHLAGNVLKDLVGGWATALESLVRGRALERRYAYEAVSAFLRALAAREPVLLVLEDLHAAGSATVELVHYLARRLSGVRLLVVATALTGEDGAVDALAGVAEVVRPGPLPLEAVRELAGDARLAEEVFRRTRGEPQLVTALLDGSPPGEEVPSAVRAIVLGRLRGLREPVRRVLRAASVLGGAFDPVLLGELLGLPPHEVAGHCERALGRGLLVVRGSAYEFANALVREVLYATTPAPTRLAYQHRSHRPLSPPQPPPDVPARRTAG
ncbi:AAA family ATPase [Nonomuraea sp. NPDC049709]|uniref:AAA family ATPase n=1 Tax=Nonomuraea sp. NPDC049709 TaxID=3154736 RepID=UPI0034378EBC